MIRKLLVSLLCIAAICGAVVSCFLFLYFSIPARKAASAIKLPDHVEDVAAPAETSTEETTSTTTFVADVRQSLTLREAPDSGAKEITGLPPLTQMDIINYVDNTSFAYVMVTTGDSKGMKGYVNTKFITKLGEPTRLAPAG